MLVSLSSVLFTLFLVFNFDDDVVGESVFIAERHSPSNNDKLTVLILLKRESNKKMRWRTGDGVGEEEKFDPVAVACTVVIKLIQSN